MQGFGKWQGASGAEACGGSNQGGFNQWSVGQQVRGGGLWGRVVTRDLGGRSNTRVRMGVGTQPKLNAEWLS